jgi:hypothetical protein
MCKIINLMKKLINRTQYCFLTVTLIAVIAIFVVGCVTSQSGRPSAYDGQTVTPNMPITLPVKQ